MEVLDGHRIFESETRIRFKDSEFIGRVIPIRNEVTEKSLLGSCE